MKLYFITYIIVLYNILYIIAYITLYYIALCTILDGRENIPKKKQGLDRDMASRLRPMW